MFKNYIAKVLRNFFSEQGGVMSLQLIFTSKLTQFMKFLRENILELNKPAIKI